MKILFVCLGNICRSAAAEAIMKELIERHSLDINVDSAGTSGCHAGEKADSRMREHGLKRGLNIDSISRQFEVSDFRKFDYIIVMDNSNHKDIVSLDPQGEYSHKISKMTDYCSDTFKDYDYVPDPYYGGANGFEVVLDLLQDSCSNFLNHLPKLK